MLEPSIAAPRIEIVSPFDQILCDYREKPHTPELVRAFDRTYWEEKAAKAGVEIVVNPFKRTAKDLSEHERNGDMVVYVPDEVAQNRALLMKLFPEYDNHKVLEHGNPFNDNLVFSGHMYIEASTLAPFTGKTEEKLKQEFIKRDRKGLNLTQYFLASQQANAVTGEFFDERTTAVRLLNSSRNNNGIVYAFFNPIGHIYAGSYYWRSESQSGALGGRSFSEAG